MLRVFVLSSLFLLPSVALAAELPRNITPEDRAAFIRKAAAAHAKAVEDWKAKAEDAKAQMKFPATAKEGKANLAKAEAALANLARAPQQVSGTLLVVIGENPKLKAGDIGIISPLGEYVATKTDDGTLVDGLINPKDEKLPTRFLIASPFEIPKAVKGKKNPPLTFTGLWYVAGFVEKNGKKVPVIYNLDIKKEEITSDKK